MSIRTPPSRHLHRALASILLCGAAGAPAAAQQDGPPLDARHEQAVLELFEVMDVEAQNRETLRTMTTHTAIAGTPIAAVMEEFVERHMGWDVIRPRLLRIYGEAFTQAEIRELIGFYRSSVGRRLVAAMPEINRRTIEVTTRLMAEHRAEFQAMLAAAMTGSPPR